MFWIGHYITTNTKLILRRPHIGDGTRFTTMQVIGHDNNLKIKF